MLNRKRFRESGPSRRPRLLVDVSVIRNHDARTGIQRVVRAIWSELRSRSDESFNVMPVFATHTHGYRFAPFDFLETRSKEHFGEVVGVQPGDKFLGLDFSAHLLPKYQDQLQHWRRHGATVHLVVHDLLPLTRPEWFNPSTVSNYARWFELLTEQADQALCISNQVAEELLSKLAPARKDGSLSIGRIQLAGDIAASVPTSGLTPQIERLLERMHTRPAILMVGTVEPRKAYDVALEAFEHLWRSRPDDAPDLVIAGKPGWKTKTLQEKLLSHPEKGRRLHWLGSVSDEALCQLYSACRGVLMTSLGEGFGLPLIEAAMHRRSVLARDLSVFREQGLASVSYFQDDAPAALAASIAEFMSQAGIAPAPVNFASWSASVDALLEEIGLVVRSRLASGNDMCVRVLKNAC